MLSAKAFHMKISFVCIWTKTNFYNKNFALSLTFIMRFTATRKWPIEMLTSVGAYFVLGSNNRTVTLQENHLYLSPDQTNAKGVKGHICKTFGIVSNRWDDICDFGWYQRQLVNWNKGNVTGAFGGIWLRGWARDAMLPSGIFLTSSGPDLLQGT